MVRNIVAIVLTLFVTSTVSSATTSDLPNVTGTWTGTLSIPQKGKLEQTPLHATFTHAGADLAGGVGPTLKSQTEITKGHVEQTQFGTSLTFDVPGTGFVMHFELRLFGDVLRGVARLDGEKAAAPVELQFRK